MKRALAGNFLTPLPVVLVGTLVDGKPDSLVIGRVTQPHVDREVLADGKLDMRRSTPVVWTIRGGCGDHRVGERLETH